MTLGAGMRVFPPRKHSSAGSREGGKGFRKGFEGEASSSGTSLRITRWGEASSERILFLPTTHDAARPLSGGSGVFPIPSARNPQVPAGSPAPPLSPGSAGQQKGTGPKAENRCAAAFLLSSYSRREKRSRKFHEIFYPPGGTRWMDGEGARPPNFSFQLGRKKVCWTRSPQVSLSMNKGSIRQQHKFLSRFARGRRRGRI